MPHPMPEIINMSAPSDPDAILPAPKNPLMPAQPPTLPIPTPLKPTPPQPNPSYPLLTSSDITHCRTPTRFQMTLRRLLGGKFMLKFFVDPDYLPIAREKYRYEAELYKQKQEDKKRIKQAKREDHLRRSTQLTKPGSAYSRATRAASPYPFLRRKEGIADHRPLVTKPKTERELQAEAIAKRDMQIGWASGFIP